jgi:mannitol/fructose-specific phosphotransferase system IIA component (Ntr-type)
MKLSDIPRAAVVMDMKAATKDEAITELVGALCDAYRLKDRDAILEAIRRREETASTGVGMGLAVPHAKTEAVDRLYMAFGLSREGIDFDCADGQPAHLFFVMVSARDRTGPHIQALAKISRLIGRPEVRDGLLSCGTAKEFLDFISDAEQRYL